MKTTLSSPLSRRDALKLGLVGMAGLSLNAYGEKASAVIVPQRPKNIILMVSDGMSIGVPSMAEAFSWMVRNKGTQWYRMLQSPDVVKGFFDSSSLNSLVPDSASVSSSWGSGSRVFNRQLNYLPDGRALKPIAHMVKEKGMRAGLVTTTTITHATPAGFAAACVHRDYEDQIAAQYLNGPDVLLGGGSFFFETNGRDDGRNLFQEFASAGYTVIRDRHDLKKASASSKLLGLFDPDHLPMALDRANNPSLDQRVPPLYEMARTALDILARDEKGFLLQIEGGRVDHAAHANDPAGILWEQVEFDDTMALVVEWARARGDTLVVITSDHGNSNPGLNGMGGEYEQSTSCFHTLSRFKRSSLSIAAEVRAITGAKKTLDPLFVSSLIEKGTTIKPTEAELALLVRAAQGDATTAVNHQHANFQGILGEILSNHTGIAWIGTTHSSDMMPALAIGPGAQRFGVMQPNVVLFHHFTELLGITETNPSMTPAEAVRYQRQPPLDLQPHWLRWKSATALSTDPSEVIFG